MILATLALAAAPSLQPQPPAGMPSPWLSSQRSNAVQYIATPPFELRAASNECACPVPAPLLLDVECPGEQCPDPTKLKDCWEALANDLSNITEFCWGCKANPHTTEEVCAETMATFCQAAWAGFAQCMDAVECAEEFCP